MVVSVTWSFLLCEKECKPLKLFSASPPLLFCCYSGKWAPSPCGSGTSQSLLTQRWQCDTAVYILPRPYSIWLRNPQNPHQVDQADFGLPQGGGCLRFHGLSQEDLWWISGSSVSEGRQWQWRLPGHHRSHPGGLWEIQVWGDWRTGRRYCCGSFGAAR